MGAFGNIDIKPRFLIVVYIVFDQLPQFAGFFVAADATVIEELGLVSNLQLFFLESLVGVK